MKIKQGFSLLEMLVVVLLIGILAAIAVPQYRKVVLKAHLHKGVSIVASLYQAEQAYYLNNDRYTMDIDALDVGLAEDSACSKWTDPAGTGYDCSWGTLNIEGEVGNPRVILFIYPVQNSSIFHSSAIIGYNHYLRDLSASYGNFKAGKRYCTGKQGYPHAQQVCENTGGRYIGESSVWKFYEMN